MTSIKKIEVLSGGEKNRVAMIKVLLSNANFLLLDEPTNHLDMYAQEVLIQALEKYKGTILFVSHDHVFIQRLATRILELTPTALHSYPGSYELYLMQKHNKQNNTSIQDKQSLQKTNSLPPKERSSIKKEINQLEHSINKLEKERNHLGLQLAEFAYSSAEYQTTINRLQQIDKLIEEQTSSWEQLIAKVD